MLLKIRTAGIKSRFSLLHMKYTRWVHVQKYFSIRYFTNVIKQYCYTHIAILGLIKWDIVQDFRWSMGWSIERLNYTLRYNTFIYIKYKMFISEIVTYHCIRLLENKLGTSL